jgi:hypothetical protein
LAHEALRRIAGLYAIEAQVRGQRRRTAWLLAGRSPSRSSTPCRSAWKHASRICPAAETHRGDVVRAGALELVDPISVRRPHRARHEPGRAGRSAGGTRTQEPALRRQRWLWSPLGNFVRETCTLNCIESDAYLNDVLTHKVGVHPINRHPRAVAVGLEGRSSRREMSGVREPDAMLGSPALPRQRSLATVGFEGDADRSASRSPVPTGHLGEQPIRDR